LQKSLLIGKADVCYRNNNLNKKNLKKFLHPLLSKNGSVYGKSQKISFSNLKNTNLVLINTQKLAVPSFLV